MGHTQNKLADLISKELGVPVRVTRKILQRFLDLIADDIVYTGEMKLRGFGSFYVTTRPAVHTTHPTTGAPVLIPRKKVLRLRTSSALRKRLNPREPAKPLRKKPAKKPGTKRSS
ncbi:MAG: HU family DNA-binding protein [Thermodesulfobacteriota bacterium]|nr:HU family DNA-binding protein [Thermodesulfobacteriota bacterium]